MTPDGQTEERTSPPIPLIIARESTTGNGFSVSNMKVAHLPFALCEILLDLSADRLVDVLVQGCVTSDPGGEPEKVDY